MGWETPATEQHEFQGTGNPQNQNELTPRYFRSLNRREALTLLLGSGLFFLSLLGTQRAVAMWRPELPDRDLLIIELFKLTSRHPALLRPHLTPIPNVLGKSGDHRVPTLVMGESHKANFPPYSEVRDALLGIVERGGNILSFIENIPPEYLLANFQLVGEIAFFEENKGFVMFIPSPQISFPTQYLNTMHLAHNVWNRLRERRRGMTEEGQYTMVFGDINILGDSEFLIVNKVADAIGGGREVVIAYFLLARSLLDRYEKTKNRIYLLGLSIILGRLADYLIYTLKGALQNEFDPPIENPYAERVMKTLLGRLPLTTVQRWAKEIFDLREILWVIKIKEAFTSLHGTPDLLTLHVGLGHLMLDLDTDLSQQTFNALVQLSTDLLEIDPALLEVNRKEINVGGRRFVLNQLTDWVSLTLLPDGRAMLVCRRSKFISDAFETAKRKVALRRKSLT